MTDPSLRYWSEWLDKNRPIKWPHTDSKYDKAAAALHPLLYDCFMAGFRGGIDEAKRTIRCVLEEHTDVPADVIKDLVKGS